MGELESIGQILGQGLDSKNSNDESFISGEEARAQGYAFGSPEPEPEQCEFCGTKLYYKGLKNHFTKRIVVWISPKRCDCEKAQAYWKKYDEDKARLEAEEREKERQLLLQQRVERLFQQSKLGDRFKTRTFENYKCNPQNKKAFSTAQKYAEGFEIYKKDGVGLIFTGPYGTGKTHLAAAIAIDLMNRGIPVIFGTLINLLGKIKATYDGAGDEQEILNLYRSVDLLVIDDLGKEKPSEWVLEKLYNILNERYENNRPVIITSNYTHETLINRLTVKDNIETAEAIVSRLYEMCRGVVLKGEDYRKI